ncbi:hypothetical protein EIN_162020 [Entamoeba invadens IP1]|uniref:Myb/SANT-like domain-containing protein n=1 Tax=Entamoeba invadens IP1 TaxID=370355 RepID=A0A0A1TYL8_ENTIV|nr:hypothetical protein EIN_162020 [Entamoeba invadens IP1]ELP86568.1 hypothetical protein EIN_162020 [Entamoeba invadens IP1]|eukprot:XP_004185914.1 hypothetical protein EIN_162020 [Entamoeba invadens IP1]
MSSAFTTVSPVFYTIITSSAVSRSSDDSLEKHSSPSPMSSSQTNKQWNDEITIFVMLKYRKWQMTGRKAQNLNHFYKTCTQDLLDVFHITKTPTQIRDKVNNTKSSFALLLKKEKQGNIAWTKEKCASLSKNVFCCLEKYFSEDFVVDQDQVDRMIAKIVEKYSTHFSVSSLLKNAILKMKTN